MSMMSDSPAAIPPARMSQVNSIRNIYIYIFGFFVDCRDNFVFLFLLLFALYKKTIYFESFNILSFIDIYHLYHLNFI